MGSSAGRRVALLGLAFKAGTDDVRDSPALAVARILLDRGAQVRAHDPAAGANARRELPGLTVVDSPAAALEDADIAVIATEWPDYRELDWAGLRDRMAAPHVINGRRTLDAATMRGLGFTHEAIGTADRAPAVSRAC